METISLDELGRLAETFNTMSSNLKNRQEELSKAHQQLSSSYQELRRLDEMKSEFMALAAHELRTPLTALRAHTEIFFKGQYGLLSDRQKKALEIIGRSVNRLTRFIDDLVDLTRLERGELELEKKPLDLSNLLVEVIREVQPVIKESNLSFVYDIPNNLPLIIGDSQRLYQVFGNLLNNAIKFTPDKGKISVIAKQEGEFIKVSVSDSGIGISPEDISKLFIPFYQVKKMPLRGVKGVGLGLVVVKRIVENLGGKIEVVSKLNEGSAFTCIFPVATGFVTNKM
ncbi:MAG: HAMP domain-containing protein [Actinobacteria bacterium]|nr:HAMP domain-containing protein [Actinomycetota bacterium]